MNYLNLAKVVCIISLFTGTVAPPRPPKKIESEFNDPTLDEDPMEDDAAKLEYYKYLKEVGALLNDDPVVREQLTNLTQEQIHAEDFAEKLHIPDETRTMLDELKRREIDRIKTAIEKLVAAEKYDEIKIPEHLDSSNLDSFQKEDLKKLIKKSKEDFDNIQKKREEEFKQYELKKETERREALKKMSEPEQRAAEEKHKQEIEQRKNHEKLKHPGGKEQLEEVWEDVDKLDKEDFNPRTFFALHDLDQDGNLNAEEIEAILVNEVKKLPGEDAREKDEELDRMRAHVFKEIDKDGNMMISLKEFLDSTDDPKFKEGTDEGWDAIGDKDDEELFSEEELKQYMDEWEKKHPDAAQPATPPGGAAPAV